MIYYGRIFTCLLPHSSGRSPSRRQHSAGGLCMKGEYMSICKKAFAVLMSLVLGSSIGYAGARLAGPSPTDLLSAQGKVLSQSWRSSTPTAPKLGISSPSSTVPYVKPSSGSSCGISTYSKSVDGSILLQTFQVDCIWLRPHTIPEEGPYQFISTIREERKYNG